MSRYDDMSEQARFYLNNNDEIELAEMVASSDARIGQLKNELAALHEGEEEPPAWRHPAASTPAQWLWHWNRATPAERLERAALIIDAGQRAGICFQMAHESTIQRLRAEVGGARRLRDLHSCDHAVCSACLLPWPCPTIEMLDGRETPDA
ncbi:hypothetical protein [Streptomyces sp. cmx-4-9]|uniref:hypothetical protein n=1 Tax=Streptomyces sp. cmx-4-9 TaxID=2790941 RepID=UPI0039811B65